MRKRRRTAEPKRRNQVLQEERAKGNPVPLPVEDPRWGKMRNLMWIVLIGAIGLGSCAVLPTWRNLPVHLPAWLKSIFDHEQPDDLSRVGLSREVRKPRKDPDYSDIMQRLWDLDVNGMTSATMRLDLQGQTNSSSKKDMAPRSLFAFVNETVLYESATVRTMKDLLDNYIHETGKTETETAKEKAEIDAFLDAVCATEVMKEAQEYLKEKGEPFPTMDSFKTNLREMWFDLYPRSRNYTQPVDSSGFEHVFVGESKRKSKEIGGMHNWIVAYLQEKKGEFDYTGYVGGYTELSPGRYVFGAKMRAYSNYWKSPFSSFIFGSSPEFDLAAYTVCFVMRPNKRCSFTLQGEKLALQVYKFSKGNHVETAYPYVPY